MDQHSSIFSPCPLVAMAAGNLSDTSAVPAEDTAPAQNGNDLWYSLGFGMSSMFFSPAFIGHPGSR